MYDESEVANDHSKSTVLSTYIKNIKASGLEVEEEKGTVCRASCRGFTHTNEMILSDSK